jgi:hypothetical protein
MKGISLGVLFLSFFAVGLQEANAVVCAAGVYHAGCVGAHGAAVVGRPVARCRWAVRAGARVCI